MLRASAGWIARRNRLPTSLRAVFGYYSDAGVLDVGSLRLKRTVDERVDAMIAASFSEIERALAEEFDHEHVNFSYETKLVLPAKLTLGYLYRQLDECDHERAEAMTQLAVDALLDGDMRDAINDDEFEDFQVAFVDSTADRRRVAELAQEVLQTRVDTQFEEYPNSVREQYERAVDISETHQDQDEYFRELLSEAQDGDETAVEKIRSEYRDVQFDSSPDVFSDEHLSFPYLKTQYDRVGIIYDAMIDMYRTVGLPVEEPFKRSIVLAIIGAQIWLDDIDDYKDDVHTGQLTPVTAEYHLHETDPDAYRAVVDIGSRYLDHAKREATLADSALTGVATEYIYRDGDPTVLPGAMDHPVDGE